MDHQYIIAKNIIKEYLSSFFVRRGKMPFLGKPNKGNNPHIFLVYVKVKEEEEKQHHHNVRTYGGRQNKCCI